MTETLRGAALALTIAVAACAPARIASSPALSPAASLTADLDALFDAPPFDTAVWSVRIERMSGAVLYEKNPRTLVMPASNMKIVTMAAAAETLGWDHRFETRLVAEGDVRDGTLHGDLRVIGGGDPSIASANFGASPLFVEWAAALRAEGISHVTGSVIGDDNAFDDEMLGAGWAWDYLAWGYAAPVSALQYGENVAVLRIRPGTREGDPATVLASPPGHGLEITSLVRTSSEKTTATFELSRIPGQRTLTITGRVPAGGPQAIRTAAVDNPTLFFTEGFRAALGEEGVRVDGPAVDIDTLSGYVPSARARAIASHMSPPLSELAANFMKVSQNMYGETFRKAVGATAITALLESWGIAPGTYAIADGSGLSRYNQLNAAMLTVILRKMYENERHRGWFLASLPISGHDGTLDRRMIGTELQRAVQAKTGTISGARAISGYLTAPTGERFIFSIIGNNFVRPASEIDAVAEAALKRVLREATPPALRAPVPPSR